ncbi:MAG TPA: 50S ribosomal protein L20 [Candidatus Paceibacterota bacterium]|jgi:large subunit ribosomal protein L20|nr:50S ribosomal protein L20 [Candidatus Paceibacterota bacterium]
MARVKGGVKSNKRRKNILAMTKGYRFGRSTKKRQAREAIFHAGKNAFAHRRDKKNDFRRLWAVRINGALDAMGSEVSYSRLIGALGKKKMLINRKMLSELALKSPDSFARLVKQVA